VPCKVGVTPRYRFRKRLSVADVLVLNHDTKLLLFRVERYMLCPRAQDTMNSHEVVVNVLMLFGKHATLRADVAVGEDA